MCSTRSCLPEGPARTRCGKRGRSAPGLGSIHVVSCESHVIRLYLPTNRSSRPPTWLGSRTPLWQYPGTSRACPRRAPRRWPGRRRTRRWGRRWRRGDPRASAWRSGSARPARGRPVSVAGVWSVTTRSRVDVASTASRTTRGALSVTRRRAEVASTACGTSNGVCGDFWRRISRQESPRTF